MMRKTDLRSRSSNAGSDGAPLFNATSANANSYVVSNEDEGNDEDNNSEYESALWRSSDTPSSSSVAHSGDLSAPSRTRSLLSPYESVAHQRLPKAAPQRRHSQQPISSPRSFVSAPEFVITSASKIPETAAPPRRSPLSSSSYSRDDTRDFSIYGYEDGNELRFVPSDCVTRRKTIQLEREPALPNSARAKDENERRWSSDGSRRERGSQEISPGQYSWNNSKQNRYHEQQDPYYRSAEADPVSARRRNTIVPPAAIVTNPGPIPVSPYRRQSAGATGLLLPVEETYRYLGRKKNVNLLSVPGYDSSSTSSSTARSRSRSTPSSPEQLRLQTTPNPARAQQECVLPNSDRCYKVEKRRSLSPEHPDIREVMHSPYYRLRNSDHAVDNGRMYLGESFVDETTRKYSYHDVPDGRAQRRQQELRRISSSTTCVVDGSVTSTNRRRVLPPTPDELSQKLQKAHINSVPPRGYERTSRDAERVSAAPSLPSQQEPTSPFYRTAGFDQEAHQMNSNSRSSNSRQIVSSEAASVDAGRRKGDDQLLRNQRVSQFDEEDVRCSVTRDRRATAIADSAMIPASSPASPDRGNSPRVGRGRKLPETPDFPKGTPPPSNKMVPHSIARQHTAGELVRRPPSPPAFGRFHAPPRRVSDQQILTQRSSAAAVGLVRQSNPTKSPGSDNEDRAAAGAVPAWTAATAAPSTKSPDRSIQRVPPSRCNMVILGHFRQSSVSSSSSVPDLITSPTNNVCAGAGAGVGADAATDSGHGSGAESGAGDVATVSGSNSWPDAIGIGGLSLGALSTTVSTPTSGADGRRVSSTGADGLLTPSSSGLGLLHFTIQYFPVRKRLRVSVIKAERLAGQLRMDLELNAFVKVCLMPGKLQKQRGSRIVKRTRDATFNEEFFFDNITPEDVETRSIHLRLCHHVGKQFQKDVVIGQLDISLRDIMTQLLGKHEVKLCQELKPKQLKKLGRLQISTCLENDARRLTINIFKVDDLPKFGISGPPDPCVRISVDQNGKVQTKQSRTLKSTCNAFFREAVMFLVSTKKEDLERTKIVVAVHDMARSGSGDDVIGNVYLGHLACDKTELEQWKNTLMHPGREFKATHQLKKEPIAGGDDDTVSINED